jgi:hypothetical protein
MNSIALHYKVGFQALSDQRPRVVQPQPSQVYEVGRMRVRGRTQN